jgi:hypothetical protein
MNMLEIEALLGRCLDQQADLRFDLEEYKTKLEAGQKLLADLEQAEATIRVSLTNLKAQEMRVKRDVIGGVYDAAKVDKAQRVKPRVMHKIRMIVQSLVHHAEGRRLEDDALIERVRLACSKQLGVTVERLSSLHWEDARDVVIELQRIAHARGIELAYEASLEPMVNT